MLIAPRSLALLYGSTLVCGALVFARFAGRARADPAPAPAEPAAVYAHVEIADVLGKERVPVDHAVFLSRGGDPGELHVEAPGQGSTSIKLRYRDRGALLDYEVVRFGADKTQLSARGETAPPPPGHKVLIARLPRPGGAIEVSLALGR